MTLKSLKYWLPGPFQKFDDPCIKVEKYHYTLRTSWFSGIFCRPVYSFKYHAFFINWWKEKSELGDKKLLGNITNGSYAFLPLVCKEGGPLYIFSSHLGTSTWTDHPEPCPPEGKSHTLSLHSTMGRAPRFNKDAQLHLNFKHNDFF